MAFTTLALPVAIAAIAYVKLSSKLDSISEAFFEYSTAEQMSVLALLFSLVFLAVGASHTLPSRAAPKKKDYPMDQLSKATSDKEQFKCLYPMLRDELLDNIQSYNELPEEAIDWMRRMMEYTVPGGKLNRGTTVLAVVRALKERPLTAYETARAAVLGWAIEFLQAFFLVADDVMDESQTRRGQTCWYKQSDVGWIAINDSFLLESFVFGILREHFGHEPYYPQLVELLLDVIQKTELGQLLDLTSQPADGEIDLTRFTLQRYQTIVKYKTAFYSFYLPVAMGMLLAGNYDTSSFVLARSICCQMGEYFQVQDDYLDCYGDPDVIGKVGTDIQDNKCSWLVVQALERCSPAQRRILQANYGQWDDAKVQKVKDLYKELNLQQVFDDYEESSYQAIQAELDVAQRVMPRQVFEVLLKKIYKRSK